MALQFNPATDELIGIFSPIWSTSPTPVKGPEFQFPNLTGNAPAAPAVVTYVVRAAHFTRIPPSSPGVDFQFPNLHTTLVAPNALILELNPYRDTRHPPAYEKAPDFIFPNFLTNLEVFPALKFNFVPYDFYRHPPPPKPPEEFSFIFAHLYHFPNFAPGTPITYPYVRNLAPEIDQVRQSGPILQTSRKDQNMLQQVRKGGPILDI